MKKYALPTLLIMKGRCSLWYYRGQWKLLYASVRVDDYWLGESISRYYGSLIDHDSSRSPPGRAQNLNGGGPGGRPGGAAYDTKARYFKFRAKAPGAAHGPAGNGGPAAQNGGPEQCFYHSQTSWFPSYYVHQLSEGRWWLLTQMIARAISIDHSMKVIMIQVAGPEWWACEAYYTTARHFQGAVPKQSESWY